MAKKKIGDCAYCGDTDVKVTRDHVINIGLWPKSKRRKIDPIFADACEACHRRFDKHFEYFRANVLISADENDPAVLELFNGPVIRSLKRPDVNRRMIDTIKSGRKLWAPNDQGIYVERVLMKIDTAAHLVSVHKMIRGLRHHHFHDCVEIEQVRIIDTAIANKKARDFATNSLRTLSFGKVLDLGDGIETFCYRYCDMRTLNKEVDSVWVLRFVGGRIFFAIVLNTEASKQQPSEHTYLIPD
jgi:hypothetical protein